MTVIGAEVNKVKILSKYVNFAITSNTISQNIQLFMLRYGHKGLGKNNQFLVTSFSTFLFHWILLLDAIFGRYLEECHPLITFPPGQFLMRRVRRGLAWTKEEARSRHQR